MNEYWLELDHYQDIKVVCNEDVVILTSMFERDRIVEFLAGLNPEYDQVRVHILSREKLPSLNEVFFIICSEEHRRILLFNDPNREGSAMVSNKVQGSWSKSQGGRNDFHSKQQNQESLWCSYCKKPKHTGETCFKLHGKEIVLSKMGGFQNLQRRNQTQAHLIIKEPKGTLEKTDPVATSELGELNAEEISKLKSFLKTIQNGSCSLAQTVHVLPLFFFIASQTVKNGLWILDSGITDHMTYDSTVFETYKPISSPKRIIVTNGHIVPIEGRGSVILNPSLLV